MVTEEWVVIWDADSGDRVRQLQAGTTWTNHIAFSPDGGRAATNRYPYETIHFWDLRTGERVATLRAHRGEICCLTFSHDSRRLLSISDDETIRLWDATAPRRPDVHTGLRDGVSVVAFHPGGELLITGGWVGEVKGWTVPGIREAFAAKLCKRGIVELIVSPDGQRIMIRTEGNDLPQVRLWSVQPFRVLTALTEPDELASGGRLRRCSPPAPAASLSTRWMETSGPVWASSTIRDRRVTGQYGGSSLVPMAAASSRGTASFGIVTGYRRWAVRCCGTVTRVNSSLCSKAGQYRNARPARMARC